MVRTKFGEVLQQRTVLACVLALIVATAMWWLGSGAGQKFYTAYFSNAVGIAENSDVRIVGVEVGKVLSVTPMGKNVRVRMAVDHDAEIPAGAHAVIVAPTMVADRYVQFTPSYSGGPQLDSGAVLGQNRTATPVELDDLYASANKLAKALGPEGANKHGALNRVLDVGANTLRGNGQALHDTLARLSKTANTLTNSKGDLFSTVDNLQKFTTMLAANDKQVRAFESKLADVSNFLGNDSGKIGSALNQLATALVNAKKMVGQNSGLIKSNVDKLLGVTKLLVDQRGALAEVLDTAPLGVSDYINAYDENTGAVTVNGSLNELTFGPVQTVCRLIQKYPPAGVPNPIAGACDDLAKQIDQILPLPSVAQLISWLYSKNGKFPLPNGGK